MPKGSVGGSPFATTDEERCVAPTRSGTRCRNRRMTGSDYCYGHAPENAQAVADHARAIARLPQPAKWGMAKIFEDEDLAAVKRAAAKAIIDVYSGKLSPAKGNAIAALLGKLTDAVTRGDFEARLRAAERELQDMREGTRPDVVIEGDFEEDDGAA